MSDDIRTLIAASSLGDDDAQAMVALGRCCGGATVTFRGEGKDAQYRVCLRWKEPGHLAEDEIQARIREVMDVVCPSGRHG